MVESPKNPPAYEALVAEETLILDATEEICRVLDEQGLLRKELAARMGLSEPEISRLLNGERNLTLRSLSRMAGALGHRVEISVAKDVGEPTPIGGTTSGGVSYTAHFDGEPSPAQVEALEQIVEAAHGKLEAESTAQMPGETARINQGKGSGDG